MDKERGLFGVKDGIYLIIAPLAIILPISYWYFTAPPPGFCVAQNRYITDEEYIKFSTNNGEVVSSGQRIVDGKPSVLACCDVKRSEGGFWSKMLRLDEGVGVDWYYERSQDAIDNYDSAYKYYIEIRTVDTCATKLLFESGTTKKTIPKLVAK